MNAKKAVEEMDEGGAYDCGEREHFRVCYKIHKYHVQQINTGLYCPSFERKQSEAEWIEAHGKTYIPLEYDENGYLILHDYTVYVCSACGRKEPKKEPYCNCGAKMKGV